MEQLKKSLEEREKVLLQLKKEKEKALAKAPSGTLRVCAGGNRTQYYHRIDPKDFNGVYIKEKDVHIAQSLAQKDYYKKVLHSIKKEMGSIKKYLSEYPETTPEQIYDKLHNARKQLVKPILESDEQYISRWENIIYEGKKFYENTPEFFTLKGERVRSKSELIIADLLNKEAIPYRYEYPIQLKGIGKIYPDFTVLNVNKRKELYWEHLGMMDEPNYVERALQKITYYEQNGIFPGENLILTYETKKTTLNQKIVSLIIQQHLK